MLVNCIACFDAIDARDEGAGISCRPRGGAIARAVANGQREHRPHWLCRECFINFVPRQEVIGRIPRRRGRVPANDALMRAVCIPCAAGEAGGFQEQRHVCGYTADEAVELLSRDIHGAAIADRLIEHITGDDLVREPEGAEDQQGLQEEAPPRPQKQVVHQPPANKSSTSTSSARRASTSSSASTSTSTSSGMCDGMSLIIQGMCDGMSLYCPNVKCQAMQDPDMSGCANVRCLTCGQFFCWVCFKTCASKNDCYQHLLEHHSREVYVRKAVVDAGHRELRVAQLVDYLMGAPTEVEKKSVGYGHISADMALLAFERSAHDKFYERESNDIASATRRKECERQLEDYAESSTALESEARSCRSSRSSACSSTATTSCVTSTSGLTWESCAERVEQATIARQAGGPGFMTRLAVVQSWSADARGRFLQAVATASAQLPLPVTERLAWQLLSGLKGVDWWHIYYERYVRDLADGAPPWRALFFGESAQDLGAYAVGDYYRSRAYWERTQGDAHVLDVGAIVSVSKNFRHPRFGLFACPMGEILEYDGSTRHYLVRVAGQSDDCVFYTAMENVEKVRFTSRQQQHVKKQAPKEDGASRQEKTSAVPAPVPHPSVVAAPAPASPARKGARKQIHDLRAPHQKNIRAPWHRDPDQRGEGKRPFPLLAADRRREPLRQAPAGVNAKHGEKSPNRDGTHGQHLAGALKLAFVAGGLTSLALLWCTRGGLGARR